MSRLSKRQDTVNSAAGEVLTDLIVPVIKLGAQFSRAGESIAAAGGQTLARWLVLETVAAAPATAAQIARRLRLARQSVQRVADLLEEDCLIEYLDNPAHQRSKLVRITPRGEASLQAIRSAQRAWATRVGSAVGEADLRRARDVVDRLSAALTLRPNSG